jgi:hypothetical protein
MVMRIGKGCDKTLKMAGKFLKVVIEVKAVSQAAFSNQQDRL